MSWISAINLTWQPAPQSAIGVFDSALLPGGVSIAEPGGHGAHGPQQGMLSEGRVIIESDGLAQRRAKNEDATEQQIPPDERKSCLRSGCGKMSSATRPPHFLSFIR